MYSFLFKSGFKSSLAQLNSTKILFSSSILFFQIVPLTLSLLLSFGLLLFHPHSAKAQSVTTNQSASLNGYVTDAQTGETLLLASVAIEGTTRGSSTNSAGYYSIVNITPGRVTILASYIGYQLFRQEITLASGENRRLDIALIPE